LAHLFFFARNHLEDLDDLSQVKGELSGTGLNSIHFGDLHESADRQDGILEINASVLVHIRLRKAEDQKMDQEKRNEDCGEDSMHDLCCLSL